MLGTLSLGRPYPGTPPEGWPDGAAMLDWHAGSSPMLVLALSMPTAAEIAAAQKAPVRIGVLRGKGASPPALLYEIRGLANGDAPSQVDLLPPELRPDLTPLRAGQRYLLTILLLSAESGTVRAIRVVSLSERCSVALRAAVAGEDGEDCALGRAGE